MGNPITRWWSYKQRKVLDQATQAPGLYRYPLGLDLEILFFSIMPPKIRSGSNLDDLQNSFWRWAVVLCSNAAFLLLIAFLWSESHQPRSKTPFGRGEQGEKELWRGGGGERQPWGMERIAWNLSWAQGLFYRLSVIQLLFLSTNHNPLWNQI